MTDRISRMVAIDDEMALLDGKRAALSAEKLRLWTQMSQREEDEYMRARHFGDPHETPTVVLNLPEGP